MGQFKDPKQLYFKPEDYTNNEALNGMLSSNFFGTNSLTASYPEGINNKLFPEPSSVEGLFDFTMCKWQGNYSVDNSGGTSKLILANNQTLSLSVYPNVEPFDLINQLAVISTRTLTYTIKLEDGTVKATGDINVGTVANPSISNLTGAKLNEFPARFIFEIKNTSGASATISSIQVGMKLLNSRKEGAGNVNASTLNSMTPEELRTWILGGVQNLNGNAIVKLINQATKEGNPASNINLNPGNVNVNSDTLGGLSLAGIKNLIPLMAVPNSYDDAKNSDGSYSGSDAVFTLKVPTGKMSQAETSTGKMVDIKGIKIWLKVSRLTKNFTPNQTQAYPSSGSSDIPNSGGSYIVRPFVFASCSHPYLNVAPNVGVNTFSYKITNVNSSSATGDFYVWLMTVGFV